MPDDVSLLLVGGNHTDTTLVQQLHQTMIDLHEKGVPVVLAVENSKGVDVDRMIRFTAQQAAELQVIAEGPIEGKTVGERVIEKAKEMGVELKDPKPYFPHVVDYNQSTFDTDHGLDDFIARVPTYKAQCDLYKFAKEKGIPLEGIDRTQEEVQNLEKTGLNMGRYDYLTTLEPFRIETMSNNLVGLMERMSEKGTGGVILTPDLGAGHVASLKTALDEKVARSQTLQDTNVSVKAISSQQEGLNPSQVEQTMKSSAFSIAQMDELYSRVDIHPKGYLTKLAEKTITNVEEHSIPIVPSNNINSHLGNLLKDKLTLQQENVGQLEGHSSGTNVRVEDDNNPGFRPGSVGSEILARGSLARARRMFPNSELKPDEIVKLDQAGEKARERRGYHR
ncbi:hypothetical protein [Roseimicrobium sp. ORNL1]|uniref:hypothetical protein n=1 Tax=Roseimicrobium sp. ORNL1 TaxID=2711231 RepID=UPI0013E10D56|nr:hypothetical protein [Roseimicrobium sp. ORNL1]QIF01309.1 hypothetical protein G5S37_07170 [Roseimicrobium sp. ORNL1]